MCGSAGDRDDPDDGELGPSVGRVGRDGIDAAVVGVVGSTEGEPAREPGGGRWTGQPQTDRQVQEPTDDGGGAQSAGGRAKASRAREAKDAGGSSATGDGTGGCSVGVGGWRRSLRWRRAARGGHGAVLVGGGSFDDSGSGRPGSGGGGALECGGGGGVGERTWVGAVESSGRAALASDRRRGATSFASVGSRRRARPQTRTSHQTPQLPTIHPPQLLSNSPLHIHTQGSSHPPARLLSIDELAVFSGSALPRKKMMKKMTSCDFAFVSY